MVTHEEYVVFALYKSFCILNANFYRAGKKGEKNLLNLQTCLGAKNFYNNRQKLSYPSLHSTNL